MEAAAAESGAKPPGAFGGLRPSAATAINPEAVTSTLSPARRLIPVSVHGILAGTWTEIAQGGIGAMVDGVFGAGRTAAAGSWGKRGLASRLPAGAGFL